MKHILTLLICLMAAVAYADDIIVTTDRVQIPCKIQSVTPDKVVFLRTDNNIVDSLSTSKVKIMQIKNADLPQAQPEKKEPETAYIERQVVKYDTVYVERQVVKHDTVYVERQGVKHDTVRVERQTVVHDTIIKSDNAPEQKVVVQVLEPKKPSTGTDAWRLALADSYAGVYVFNDCTPVNEYEIIGEISWGKGSSLHTGVAVNPLIGSVGTYTSISSSAQYCTIRDNLVASAVIANRAVEGIIVKTPKEGFGSAVMIRFKNSGTNNALARVNVHRGLLVFSDCKPYATYDGVERVKAKSLLWENTYDYIRDDILKKTVRKSGIDGIIIHLVTDGRDYAETIKFTNY